MEYSDERAISPANLRNSVVGNPTSNTKSPIIGAHMRLEHTINEATELSRVLMKRLDPMMRSGGEAKDKLANPREGSSAEANQLHIEADKVGDVVYILSDILNRLEI
jgi:hypothetical protein